MSDLNGTESTAAPPTHPMGMFHRIPREIRDMIFQYLLDSRYTRLKRRTREDPAWKFHTNILAVNRAIHAEAKELLGKRNTFVVASHTLQPDDANKLMRKMQLWVPLVAWKSIAAGEKLHYMTTMGHSSFQVHFMYDPDRMLGFGNPYSAPLQAMEYIFLAADLDSYCSVLSGRTNAILGPAFNLSGQGPPAVDFSTYPDDFSASLAITFSNPIHDEITSRVTSLNSPFRNVIAPSLCVGIGRVVDGCIFMPTESWAVERIRRHMGPSLTCTKAADWAFFEIYEARKTIADATALGGELNLALAMYEDILPIVSGFVMARRHFPRRPDQPHCAVRLLEADLRMTKAHIIYKLRGRAGFKTHVTRTIGRNLFGCYLDFYCDFTQQPETLKWISYLVVVALIDDNVEDVPLRCVDLRRTSPFARKPGYIDGWWDLKTLSQTSEGFRTTINRLLSERGLPLAPFT
jgi:hypothetical protein